MPDHSVPTSRKKRILIVEDEDGARAALVHLLGDRYDVVAAADGVEGFARAAETAPDLILTDVTMPRLDGLEMVRLVRARLQRRVPVIFLTANDKASDFVAGIQAGARHYLTKPVDIDDLERRIEQTLA